MEAEGQADALATVEPGRKRAKSDSLNHAAAAGGVSPFTVYVRRKDETPH
jgi:hypothetical protein